MQNLSKQIDFHNLTDYFKVESAAKKFIGLKGPLDFSKNIKEGYITLEKPEEKQSAFKSDLNDKSKGRYKPENQESVTKNIKHFTNHEKNVSNCLMIILELYLKLNT